MRWRRNSMKYILYVLSFFCLLIGGGAWFFYNHPVGVIGVILSLYILYRLERQPHKLSLKWPGSKGKGASRDQAAFEKAVSLNPQHEHAWADLAEVYFSHSEDLCD